MKRPASQLYLSGVWYLDNFQFKAKDGPVHADWCPIMSRCAARHGQEATCMALMEFLSAVQKRTM